MVAVRPSRSSRTFAILVDVLDEFGYEASGDTNTDQDYVFSQPFAGSFQIGVWEWFQAKLTPAIR